MFGGDGKDDMNGGIGDDVVYGDSGNDKVSGFDGDDTLFGGDGQDVMHVGCGEDVMNGGVGGDVLRGAHGDDTLSGDGGDDLLIGGMGADVYTFDLLGEQSFGTQRSNDEGLDSEEFYIEDATPQDNGTDTIDGFTIGSDKITLDGSYLVGDSETTLTSQSDLTLTVSS
jgi:Ca2+-binding RTX toxin-like protein